MRRAAALFAVVLLAGAAAPALAEPPPAPDRPLTDPADEARARALFGDIRCVVCQHESIADSPAGIAADLRGLVREQIAAGKTDDEIKDDLIRRYGDYVLFKPPLRIGTWLLWFGPFALAAGAGVVLVLRARRRSAGEAAPLTPEEERALAVLTADEAER